MKSQGSLVSVGLIALVLGVGAGCKKDEPPKPEPAAQPTVHAKLPPRVNARNPAAAAKMDPQESKNYRIDVCYYGTLSLRQARDAYLGSLGKEEPSDKKIPSFGGTAVAASLKAPPPPKPAAAPTAGATAGPAADHRPDFAMRMPHERNARACNIALSLKEPAMGEVDAALAAYAPFAVELAKDVTSAAQYYQREEYKKDAFAKGKELDKKLREGFGKLDEMQEKVRGALAAWHKEHTPDVSKMEPGEKLARASLDDAREVFMLVAMKRADGEAWKAAVEKLDKSAEALKSYSGAHQADTWTRILATPLDVFMKTIKESKVMPDKTFDADAYLSAVNNFVGLVEARQRAAQRGALTRPGIAPQPGSPAAPAEPAPAPAPAEPAPAPAPQP